MKLDEAKHMKKSDRHMFAKGVYPAMHKKAKKMSHKARKR